METAPEQPLCECHGRGRDRGQHGQLGGVGSHLRGSRALLSAAGGTRELMALKLLIHNNGRRQEEEIESNVRFSG